jgi:hypothetical protein
MLDAAAQKAVAEGRNEVADFLRLKATNDAIRSTAVKWLMETFVDTVGSSMSADGRLTIELQTPYTFKRGTATMVGEMVEARYGVRKLILAAGWTRHPSHGIMQNGSLAFARFIHFGMPEAGAELRLVHADGLPEWRDEEGLPVDSSVIEQHINLFLS